MIKEVNFNNKILTMITNNKVVTKKMSGLIGQTILCDNKVIVRLKVTEETEELNVLCLNSDGGIVWQVQDPDMWRTGKRYEFSDLFGFIWIEEDGSLWGRGGQSVYQIDKETGKILQEVFTK